MTLAERACARLTVAVVILLLVAVSLTAQAIAREHTAAELIEIWQTQGWKTDFSNTRIDLTEVGFGGPPRDGIPSIDAPTYRPVSEVSDLADAEPVVSIAIDGTARAYPLGIVTFHEIVNDEIASVPVTVTYCPLCNTAIAFDRRVDGEALEFGTTGLLRKSNLVMYDRSSDSWWQQFDGAGIVGMHAGKQLELIPVRIEAFALFRDRFPDGEVLNIPEGFRRPYGNNPYVGYDSRAAPYALYDGSLPDDIAPMARVVALKGAHAGLAVSLALLVERGEVEIDGFTFTYRPGQASALDTRRVAEGKDVGNVIVTRQDNGTASDVVHDVTFAFVYRAFHPQGRIVQAQPGQ